MKIYTKTGDGGMTSLIGGKRVKKNHLRIEAYGTVDELIAFTGLLRDMHNNVHFADKLIYIQDQLMICAAILATDCDDCEANIPKLSSEAIVWLEKQIDDMESGLTPLKQFVLPGGHPVISMAHVARTVCRRAERCILSLSEKSTVPGEVVQFMNRLSDYFFVLSRHFTTEYQVVEIPWNSHLNK